MRWEAVQTVENVRSIKDSSFALGTLFLQEFEKLRTDEDVQVYRDLHGGVSSAVVTVRREEVNPTSSSSKTSQGAIRP